MQDQNDLATRIANVAGQSNQPAAAGTTPASASSDSSSAGTPSGNDLATRMANVAGGGNTDSPPASTIGPASKASDLPTFGYDFQSPEQRLTMPLIKTLIAAHDKLRDVENFTQEGRAAHPVQAALGDIADKIEGFLVGGAQNAGNGIGDNTSGIVTNPITGALIPGAGGEPAAAGLLRGGAGLVKSGVQAIRGTAAEGTPIERGVAKAVSKITSSADVPAGSPATEAQAAVKAKPAETGTAPFQNVEIRPATNDEMSSFERAKASMDGAPNKVVPGEKGTVTYEKTPAVEGKPEVPGVASTDQQALRELVGGENTKAGRFYGTTTNWNKALDDFDALGSAEQKARFTNPTGVRDALRTQATIRTLKLAGVGLGGISEILHHLGLPMLPGI